MPQTGADAVLLSGWARLPGPRDRGGADAGRLARTGRAAARGRRRPHDRRQCAGGRAAARELGADEVVVVTSSWHQLRARLLLRAALGPDVKLELISPARTRRPLLLGREAVCIAFLPLQLRAVRRRPLPAPLPGR